MQAIRTKYIGPTNTKGARVTARCAAGGVTVPYDCGLNIDGNHRAACDALRASLGWTGAAHGAMVGGCADNGDYYWVFVTGSPRSI